MGAGAAGGAASTAIARQDRRQDERWIRPVAVLTAVVFCASVAAWAGHDRGPRPEAGLAAADPTPDVSAPESPPASEQAPSVPTDLAPADLAAAAEATWAAPARFDLSVDLLSWPYADRPRITSTGQGIFAGDRTSITIEAVELAEVFAEVPWSEGGALLPPWITRFAVGTAATRRLLTVIADGRTIYVCGLAADPDGCMVATDPHHLLATVAGNEWPSWAGLDFGGGAQVQLLAGADTVEHAGVEEVRGTPVAHVRGTYTFGAAFAAAPHAADAMRRWNAALGVHSVFVDHLLDRPMPYDAWVGADGLVHRVSTSVPGEPRDTILDGVDVASMIETGDHPVVTTTVERYEIGGSHEVAPPDGATPYPPPTEPPPPVDPRDTGELDVEEFTRQWERMLAEEQP